MEEDYIILNNKIGGNKVNTINKDEENRIIELINKLYSDEDLNESQINNLLNLNIRYNTYRIKMLLESCNDIKKLDNISLRVDRKEYSIYNGIFLDNLIIKKRMKLEANL
jgi:hypothetical protein